MAQEKIDVTGLPPDEPIEFQAGYCGKQSTPDNASMCISHLEHLIEMVEARRIEQGSLHMEFHLGTQRIKVERLPNETDIKHYPTGEFTLFLHFRFED